MDLPDQGNQGCNGINGSKLLRIKTNNTACCWSTLSWDLSIPEGWSRTLRVEGLPELRCVRQRGRIVQLMPERSTDIVAISGAISL